MKARHAATMLVVLLAPGVALAADVQFCIEIETNFTDSSWTEGNQAPDWKLDVLPIPLTPVTEDNWTTKIFERPPRGAKYKVRRNSVQVQEGYLGDGFDSNKPAGCTDNITGVNLLASWTIDVYSEGIVQSNYLYSYDHTKTSRAMSSLYLGYNPPAGRNATVQFPASSDPVTADVMAGYFGASFALYRHAGGETGNNYYLYRCACDSSCNSTAPYSDRCTCTPGATCRVGGNNTSGWWGAWRVSAMTSAGLHRKFTLVHELGHAIAQTISNGVPNGAECDDNDTAAACSTAVAGDHAFWSREKQKCAFGEGFADFYSADVWNSHSAKDCAFKYWTTNNSTTNQYGIALGGAVFDCAGDDGLDFGGARDDFTNGQDVRSVDFLQNCSGSPWAGKATEIDYTRVLWNVHTDGTSPPTFTDIARWIRDSGPPTCEAMNQLNVYEVLECSAEPRNDSLEANWDANKGPHNIDNPEP